MSKLIESLIENNYKEANDVLKEHIAEIVERKMCEMKKMMSARVSEERLTPEQMKKIKDKYQEKKREENKDKPKKDKYPKMKDIMESYKAKKKQQNEELTLPSGRVMTATGETANQSVVKQRRGQV